MSGAGLFQLVALCVVLAVTAIPLGRYMAAVYGARADGSAPGDRFFAPIERVDLPAAARRPRPRAALERLRHRPARRSASCRSCRSTCCSGSRARCRSTRRTCRRSPRSARSTSPCQLHDEHELAVVQRRADDEPPHPDGRPVGAELRVGRRRDGRRRRHHPRHQPARSAHARQLLGRPHPHHAAHPAAAVVRRRHRCCRSAGSCRTSPATPTPRRSTPPSPPTVVAVDPRRAGGQPGRHQAARHQRRRVLQRQLGPPVREPDRHHQLHRELGDPASSRSRSS